MCVCLCVYVCMFVYVSVFMFVCVPLCMFVCVCDCVPVWLSFTWCFQLHRTQARLSLSLARCCIVHYQTCKNISNIQDTWLLRYWILQYKIIQDKLSESYWWNCLLLNFLFYQIIALLTLEIKKLRKRNILILSARNTRNVSQLPPVQTHQVQTGKSRILDNHNTNTDRGLLIKVRGYLSNRVILLNNLRVIWCIFQLWMNQKFWSNNGKQFVEIILKRRGEEVAIITKKF